MRKACTGLIASIAGVLLLSGLANAQTEAERSPWKYYPDEVRANEKP